MATKLRQARLAEAARTAGRAWVRAAGRATELRAAAVSAEQASADAHAAWVAAQAAIGGQIQ